MLMSPQAIFSSRRPPFPSAMVAAAACPTIKAFVAIAFLDADLTKAVA
jgi:hypothetical protein